MRVAVPLGKSRIHTAIVQRTHKDNSAAYEIKDIEFIIDEEPMVTIDQLRLWEWMASYYMCSVGQVMKAAMPRSLMLESETVVMRNTRHEIDMQGLDDREFLIMEALGSRSSIKVQEVMEILDRKTVLPILKKMLASDLIILQEEHYSTYKPKLHKYIYLHPDYNDEVMLKLLLEELSRATKQRDAVMTLFMMKAGSQKEVSKKELMERSGVSAAIISTLVIKEVFIEVEKTVDRVLQETGNGNELYQLNEIQQQALDAIDKHHAQQKTVLLYGVTSSGKTEVYVRLIQQQLETGKQSLYLLPEIALTTQLIARLKHFFKDQVLVYHSRYSLNERLEVWNHVLNATKPFVIVGARSAVFLPFNNLGLVVVDEEHETSFKQFDPAPRYHARDTAIVLATLHGAQIVLGSATPSLESYFNAQKGKYALVEMNKRFNDLLMPEINMVDLKDKHHRKKMQGLFSNTLIEGMKEAFASGNQVILFQNRRGFSPIMECTTCGLAPQCPNCDVSLTYHKFKNQLRCHYCGFHTVTPQTCPACSSHALDTKGFGTEQVEQQFKELFPDSNIARMDLDTTRGKNSYEKLIDGMDTGDIDCLVGTQMVTKGLDFRNVSLVGVINADSLLNYPDFRSHERCYQLLSQVAGRAGRTSDRGKVLIQTYNPDHRILQQVSTHDYITMYKEQLQERRQFQYPPYIKMIRITLKHKDYNHTQEAANWFVNALQNIPKGVEVLGPEFPPVSRIRNLYLINIVVKVSKSQSMEAVKNYIRKVSNSFESIKHYRSVRSVIDVDFN